MKPYMYAAMATFGLALSTGSAEAKCNLGHVDKVIDAGISR